MKKTVTALLLCVAVSAAARAAHEVRPEHDRLGFGVVETVPGMDKVAVKTLVYKKVAERELEMDVYSPPGGAPASRAAVVFINGVGDFGGRKIRTWGQYTTWPRLLAASGMVAVTFDARGEEDNVGDVGDALAYVRSHGRELGIDPARVAAWACSANVRSAMTVLMQPGPVPVRAAVLYYGDGDAPELRRDLPVFLARAGKDSPQMNEGLDELAARALQANAPWTVLNVAGGHHGFDVLDDTEESRTAIRATLAFLRAQLEPPPAVSERPVHEGRVASAHVMAGEWAEAETAYARFVERDAKDVDALVFLASAQVELKKNAEAAANLKKALALDPDMGEAWSKLGKIEAEAKNYPAALEALNKAIALGPQDGEAHHQLGKVRLAQHDAPGAVAALERSVELSPWNGWAWHNLALAYMTTKQPAKAAAAFEHVLPYAPQNANLLYNTACAYALSGDRGKAMDLLERAVGAGFKDKAGLMADPDLSVLRSEPRFAEILKRLS